MPERSARSVLARNTAYTVAGYVVGILLPLVTTPYVVSKLGTEAWGVWVILSALGGWMAHSDFGLWGGISREVATRHARNDVAGLRSLFATWFVYDLAAGALLLIAALGAARWVPASFELWMLTAVISTMVPPLRHLVQTLYGLQRHDLVNVVGMVVGPVSFGGLVALLEGGSGLLGVAINTAAFGILQIGIFAVLLARLGYPVSLAGVRPSELRGLFAFGWPLEAVELVQQVYRSDRLLLRFLGVAPAGVAIYSFGTGIADKLTRSVQLLTAAVVPAASALSERGDRDRLGILFQRGVKYQSLAAAGLLVFAAGFADELLLFWLGSPYPAAAAVLRWLTLGAYATAAASCAQALGIAFGRPGRSLSSALVGLGVALILYSAGGHRYYGYGLAACVSLGVAVGQGAFMIGFRGSLEFRWRELVGNALVKPFAAALPAAAVWIGWRVLAPHCPALDGRMAAAALLVPAFALTAVAAWGLSRLLRVIDDYDLDVLRSLIRRRPA